RRIERGWISLLIFSLITEIISSKEYNSFTLISTKKLHSEGTILWVLFSVWMEVTAICTGPKREETFGNWYVLSHSMSFTAVYKAFTPSLRAACPAVPWAVQSRASKPLLATAIFINVGSPT